MKLTLQNVFLFAFYWDSWFFNAFRFIPYAPDLQTLKMENISLLRSCSGAENANSFHVISVTRTEIKD